MKKYAYALMISTIFISLSGMDQYTVVTKPKEVDSKTSEIKTTNAKTPQINKESQKRTIFDDIRENEYCRLTQTLVPLLTTYSTGNPGTGAATFLALQAFFDGQKGLSNTVADIGIIMLDMHIKNKYNNLTDYEIPAITGGLVRSALQIYFDEKEQVPYTIAETIGGIAGKKLYTSIVPHRYMPQYTIGRGQSVGISRDDTALFGKNIGGALVATYQQNNELRNEYAAKAIFEPAFNIGVRKSYEFAPETYDFSTPKRMIGTVWRNPVMIPVLRDLVFKKISDLNIDISSLRSEVNACPPSLIP